MKPLLRQKPVLPPRATPWLYWVRRQLPKRLPTAPSVSFYNTLPFTTAREAGGTDTSVVLWDGQKKTVSSSTVETNSTLVFFNPGSIGAMNKIGVEVTCIATEGGTSFSMFWKGAADLDSILPFRHNFWTGVTVPSNTQTVFAYWANVDGDKFATGGTPTAVASEYMFSVPFIAIGMENTGAESIQYEMVAYMARI